MLWAHPVEYIKVTGCVSVLKDLSNHCTVPIWFFLWVLGRFLTNLGEGNSTLLSEFASVKSISPSPNSIAANTK